MLFNVADRQWERRFCHGDEAAASPANLATEKPSRLEFETSKLCFPTGLKVKTGYKYEITIQVVNAWYDGEQPTGPLGYHTSQLAGPKYYLAIPLRRVIFRAWFRLLARVGEKGVDEYFLDPVAKKGTGVPPNTYTALQFKADRDGELFLYVNDATLGLPWLNAIFYKNNHGSAKISLRLL